MLRALAEHIRANPHPITITLENNRRMPDKTEGDSLGLVLQAVKDVAMGSIRVRLDMGHYAYYAKTFFPEKAGVLPPDDAWRWIAHTHIHALNGLKTHFPLGSFELDLEACLEQLSYGYFGIFNIELEFSRFEVRFIPMDALKQSVACIKEHLQHCTRVYQRTRLQLDSALNAALSLWEGEDKSGMALIHSTSYLFRTKDFFWGMDIAFREALQLCENVENLQILPKKCV